MFRYRGGITVHPHVFRSALAHHSAVTAYQVRQTERGANIDVQLIGDLELDGLRKEIEIALEKVGLVNAEVAIRPVESLERGAIGKLRRFVPMVPSPSSN